MLLPEDTLKEEIGNRRRKLSMWEMGIIKKQYGISIKAIVLRAKICGIISENYAKQFLLLVRKHNWNDNKPVAYLGLEQSNRFEQLLFRALVEDQISITKAASLMNLSLASFKKQYQPMF